jgi:hypothetical protein
MPDEVVIEREVLAASRDELEAAYDAVGRMARPWLARGYRFLQEQAMTKFRREPGGWRATFRSVLHPARGFLPKAPTPYRPRKRLNGD